MNFSKYIIAIALLCSSTLALAGSITVIGDVNVESSSNDQFYLNVLGDSQNVHFVGGTRGITQLPGLFNGQSGVSTTSSTTIIPSNLNNADLLVVASSNFNVALTFSQTELGHLNSFNGDVLLVLEASSNQAAFDSFDDVLEALGSSIRHTRNRISGGISNSMETHPLTAGITNFSMATYNTFTGGTTLLFDSSSNSAIVTEGASNSAVPEPSTYVAFLLGLFFFPFVKRNKN